MSRTSISKTFFFIYSDILLGVDLHHASESISTGVSGSGLGLCHLDNKIIIFCICGAII